MSLSRVLYAVKIVERKAIALNAYNAHCGAPHKSHLTRSRYPSGQIGNFSDQAEIHIWRTFTHICSLQTFVWSHAKRNILIPYSNVGGEFPLPTMVCTPLLVTSSTVKKIVAGPGGYTRPFGGSVKVIDLRSLDTVCSRNTRRALEWNACEENPRSINDTNQYGKHYSAVSTWETGT